MKQSNQESALSRWSRLKEESRHAPHNGSEKQNISKAATVNESPTDIDGDTEKVDINLLTDADMPDIETLNEDSDYRGFLSKNVSEGLRKMALRKLFQSRTYNICDGLDDYDGIYTKFEKLDASIITADMKHRLEIEAKRKLEQLAEDESIEKLESDNSIAQSDEQLLITDNNPGVTDNAPDDNMKLREMTDERPKT